MSFKKKNVSLILNLISIVLEKHDCDTKESLSVFNTSINSQKTKQKIRKYTNAD